MSNRKPLSKKIRFEVFKRDSFKCQYCGKGAPDVVLHVDHIKPVAEGGTNDMTNLITACFDCNMGKKHRLLDDNTVLEKQKQQLEELNERRLQLEMMMEWREGLVQIDNDKLAIAQEKFEEAAICSINSNGLKKLRTIIKKFPFDIVLDSIDVSVNQYLKSDGEGYYTSESIEKSFNMIGRICTNKVKGQEKPYLKELYYIRGILRNRLAYVNDYVAFDLLEKAYFAGASLESLKELSKEVRNWTMFKGELEDFIERHSDE